MVNYYLFTDQTNKNHLKDFKKTIIKAVDETLKAEGFTPAAEVSITLTNNEGIQKLNMLYRSIDKPTDVLSFPASEFDEELEKNHDNGALILGDIVISVEKVIEQANEYGHNIEREIAFLTVHSVLHLLGYDHDISKDEEKLMFERQEQILTSAGFLRQENQYV